jgi:hypothetical protein
MSRHLMFLLVVLSVIPSTQAFDLNTVRNEPNLEKRSELALNNANTVLQGVKDAYQKGDLEKTKSAAEELGESVELAYSCLIETHKNARKNPKFFKKAELSTRDILRRLEGMVESMSVDDREVLESVRSRVANVHEKLIQAIMGNKE